MTPQALLPVVPYLSDELTAASPAKRLEAVRLMGRLFGQRGGAAVAAEWEDVLLELLRRFVDERVRAACVCVWHWTATFLSM